MRRYKKDRLGRESMDVNHDMDFEEMPTTVKVIPKQVQKQITPHLSSDLDYTPKEVNDNELIQMGFYKNPEIYEQSSSSES